MPELPSLRDVQKRTLHLTTYEDGLWDLLLGMIFMLLAAYPVTRASLGPAWNLVLFVGLMLLLVAIQPVIRRRVSTPRIGYVKPRRTPALKWLLVATTALVALTGGLVILTLASPGWLPNPPTGGGPEWLRSYAVEIIVLFLLAGLFSGMGYVFGVPRLYGYGWLLGSGNLVSAVLYQGAPEGFNVPLALAAGVILVIGLSLFLRFLRKYPVPTPDA